jgi:hypothetical protein
MEDKGPFDRILQPEPPHGERDRSAAFIVAATIILGVILLALVLPPISILDSGGDGGGDGTSDLGPVVTRLRDELPAPPDGFEAVSGLYDLETREPVDRAARLTVNLSSNVSSGEQLLLFTYVDGEWRQIGTAEPVAGGDAAQGEVATLPANVAVFRGVQQSRTVIGSLRRTAEPDEAALEALSTLYIRGFGPTADGGITGGSFQAPDGVDAELGATISATSAEGVANVDAILDSPDLRNAHVQAILDFAQENDLASIEIDYEQIDAAKRDAFTSFVEELASGLTADDRSLVLTLPAPVRAADGFDTLGFDWETLAPLVSTIKVASINEQDVYHARMEEALGYLVPRVGASKLLLTITPLSRERGVDGVRALALTDALGLASMPSIDPAGPVASGSEVQASGLNLGDPVAGGGLTWDDTARSVVFNYTGAGGLRTVWLANAFSEAFKLDLARRYQLGGIAIDDVSEQVADAGIAALAGQYASSGAVDLVKPNGDMLTPRWQASDGELTSDVGMSVTWSAPEEAGTYTLTLIVSDGVLRVGRELSVVVETPAGARAR